MVSSSFSEKKSWKLPFSKINLFGDSSALFSELISMHNASDFASKSNSFFGKKHTDESKRKMVEGRDYSNYRTEEFREKISKLTVPHILFLDFHLR